MYSFVCCVQNLQVLVGSHVESTAHSSMWGGCGTFCPGRLPPPPEVDPWVPLLKGEKILLTPFSTLTLTIVTTLTLN